MSGKFGETALDGAENGKTALDGAKNDKAVFARHSLLAAAQFGTEELMAEHIACEGTDLAACDGCRRTALVVACDKQHAAGALDVLGGDGFSALLGRRSADGTAWRRACASAAPQS